MVCAKTSLPGCYFRALPPPPPHPPLPREKFWELLSTASSVRTSCLCESGWGVGGGGMRGEESTKPQNPCFAGHVLTNRTSQDLCQGFRSHFRRWRRRRERARAGIEPTKSFYKIWLFSSPRASMHELLSICCAFYLKFETLEMKKTISFIVFPLPTVSITSRTNGSSCSTWRWKSTQAAVRISR